MKNSQSTTRRLRFVPRTLWGRGLFGLGICVLLLLITAASVVFSVWIEDRFPSEDKTRSLAPFVQRLVTKPIVDVLNHAISRYVHSRVEARYMKTGLTLEQTIARFLDEHVDFNERRIYAYRLARIGSREAVDALLKVFKTAPPEHKAFMAQLIGSTGNPEAKKWLWPLLNDPDERVVSGAIRGLAALGGDEVLAKLAGILSNDQRTNGIRAEAAQGLGTIGTPEAHDALVKAFGQVSDDDVATQIVKSLAEFSFPTVAETFSGYLSAPDTPDEMRVVAVEALAYSTQEAVPFLMNLAGNDADPDVRASAAWAVSMYHDEQQLGPTLAALAQQEDDPDVRRRLYEAMLTQETIPTDHLLPLVQAEDDIAARVAGFGAIAIAAKNDPVVRAFFNQQIVPELVWIATSDNSVNIQLRSVFDLRMGPDTPAVQKALVEVVNKATNPKVVIAAQNGIRL